MKATITISRKLLSDLLDMAIFRVEELQDRIAESYLCNDKEGRAENKKRITQTNRVIARASKAYDAEEALARDLQATIDQVTGGAK